MSKKDYQLIAAAIGRCYMVQGIGKKSAHDRETGQRAVKLVAIDLAASLAADNPSFDRDRFMQACGVQA